MSDFAGSLTPKGFLPLVAPIDKLTFNTHAITQMPPK